MSVVMCESTVRIVRPMDVVAALVAEDGTFADVYAAMPKEYDYFIVLAEFFSVAAKTAWNCGAYSKHSAILVAWDAMHVDWETTRESGEVTR